MFIEILVWDLDSSGIYLTDGKSPWILDESSVEPIKNLSISYAASLPSEIAHTIKDWPLLKSPAAKTFLSEVWYFFVNGFEKLSAFNLRLLIIWLSGPVNPRANSTRSQGHTFSEPSISTNFAFSFGFFIHSTSIVFNAFTFPLPSFINSFVKIDLNGWLTDP